MAEDYRIFSDKELLTNLRNQTNDQYLRHQININFYTKRSLKYKKTDEDYKACQQKIADNTKKLEDNALLLSVVDEMLQNSKDSK